MEEQSKLLIRIQSVTYLLIAALYLKGYYIFASSSTHLISNIRRGKFLYYLILQVAIFVVLAIHLQKLEFLL